MYTVLCTCWIVKALSNFIDEPDCHSVAGPRHEGSDDVIRYSGWKHHQRGVHLNLQLNYAVV